MTLSDKEIRNLLGMVASTRKDEIDCDACLEGMSAFAEASLAGKPLDDARRAIKAHLAMCPECEQEYRTLLTALEDGGA